MSVYSTVLYVRTLVDCPSPAIAGALTARGGKRKALFYIGGSRMLGGGWRPLMHRRRKKKGKEAGQALIPIRPTL